MPFFAPVIREVARRVFDHPNPDGAELPRAPKCFACGAGVLCGWDVRPVGGAKRDVVYFHKSLKFLRFAPIVKGYPLFWRA